MAHPLSDLRRGSTPAWLGLAARLIVGGVMIAAGLIKLPDPAASIESVRAFELVPASLVEPIGHLLPPLEVVVGLALVLGLMTRGAAVISAVLLVAFIIAIASAWARGLEIDCGCFGDGGANPDAASQYPWEIARDVGLLALSVFLARLRSSRLALDSLLFRPPVVPEPTPALDDLNEGSLP
ncbi:MauE/DoxX family redox-associated membrane protein [Nocardioides sp.]|uniref:MauE/DoxX family redox-associated membrane protein n=1 Tax=Nocardioides sp. TaxID=35761 RepID=UPI0026331362|nr:MauE/DoxX family redox-associated membrane protein [Nocardioides sp.]